MHPIFQWLDYQYDDYGGFARVTDERCIGGFKNRLIAGVNLHNGEIDNQPVRQQLPAPHKGALLSQLARQVGEHLGLRRELVLLPARAWRSSPARSSCTPTRDRDGPLPRPTAISPGAREFDLWSPKVGLLWDVDRGWQVFANVSRSAEVPSFGENTFTLRSPSPTSRRRRATTYEIGTRGRRPDYTWDLAALSRRDRERAAVPVQRVRQLQRRQRRPDGAPGPRDRLRRRRSSKSHAGAGRRRPTGSGSTSPTPSTTSTSTAMRSSATTCCRARRGTSCAPSCSTSIRAASSSGPTSNGCRRPTSSTAPTR